MFRGSSVVSVDAKGRIVVPVRYRPALQTVVITIDTCERCLLLYPLRVWEDIESRLACLPALDPEARRIQRLLTGHATDTEADSHGRILLPPLLREYASLEHRAVMAGLGKKMELWDEASWHARRQIWLSQAVSASVDLSEELRQLPL